MEKISLLLNENTIVDFRLLWKLSLRYRSHFIIAAMLTCAIFLYSYYKQPVIYAVNVPVKVISNHTVSNDLSALVPVDNVNALTVSELKISLENYSFLKAFAELTIAEPQFDSFNLGSVNSNKNVFGKEIKKICGKDKDCLVEKVALAIKPLFSIEQGLTENRFILEVNGIDKKTVQKLTPVLIKAIEENRVHVRQYLVLKEIQSVGKLIAESRSILQKMEGYKALEEQEKLQSNIDSQKEEIKMLQFSASQELANFKALESRLLQNKRTARARRISSKDEYDHIIKNQTRLNEITQNILILSLVPEEKRSNADSLIIEQLKAEKEILQKKLPSEPNRKSMELAESFAEGQRAKSGDIEFDYVVSKNKLEKLTNDFEAAKEKLNEMLERKISNESKVTGLKTDLEFLKNLETKQMSLKLLNATMTPDLYFEDSSSLANEFRQSSYLKIFLFSGGITFFLYFFSIVIRFLLDDRIYGEDEIRGYFKELDFIGEVPKFD